MGKRLYNPVSRKSDVKRIICIPKQILFQNLFKQYKYHYNIIFNIAILQIGKTD